MEKLNRIPRIVLHEQDFPGYVPADIQDTFLDIVNSDGKIMASFFISSLDSMFDPQAIINESMKTSGRTGISKPQYMSGKEFAAIFDGAIEPSYLWEDIEFRRWLPERLDVGEDWSLLNKLLIDSGAADLSSLSYWDIPDGWQDLIMGDEILLWDNSNLPGLLLMAYGRLSYPYELMDEKREIYQLYVREYVRSGHFFMRGSRMEMLFEEYPGEIGNLIKFCASVFESDEEFRKAFLGIHQFVDPYNEITSWKLDSLVTIADVIISPENIDILIDAAHAKKRTGQENFLTRYKEKLIPSISGG